MIKLMRGDCLERMKEIPDGIVDLVLTDPPYGTTKCKWDSVIPFAPMWEQLTRVIKHNGAIVLFAKEPFSSLLRISNLSMFKYDWIWKKDTKSNFPQAGFQPLNNIEDIIVFSKGYARNFPVNSKLKIMTMVYNPQMTKGNKYNLPKESNCTDIFKINNKNGVYKHKHKDTTLRFPFNIIEIDNTKERIHPTQKPLALMEYLIKTYTNQGEIVLDFTMGSGTTGVSCINTNRSFIGIEKDVEYFKIAKNRIQIRYNEIKGVLKGTNK